MAQNIEIKARLKSPQNAEKKLIEISDNKEAIVLNQSDIFYKFPVGRLKSRTINNNYTELIFYIRPNKIGPKNSFYLRFHPIFPKTTERLLSKVLGIKGTVEKQRKLFMIENTRVHIDRVKELGSFIELEYVIDPSKNIIAGRKKVNELLNVLSISEDSLCEKSYMEMQ